MSQSALRRSLVVSVALTALAGCAAMPRPGAGRDALPLTTVSAEARLRAAEADWPTDRWWTRYGDPQLNALMDEALKGSPTLAQAAARMRTANAARSGALAADLPHLGVSAEVQEAKQSYKYLFPKAFIPAGYTDYGQGALNLNWELDFWGRNRARIAAATSRSRAAQADAAEARLLLTTDIAAAWAQLAQLQVDRATAQQALKVREQTLTLVQDRVRNGLDTNSVLRQAEAGPANARAALAELDEAIDRQRNAIAALVGAAPDRGLDLAAVEPSRLAPWGLPADLKLHLLGRRPDIVAARWRVEAAKAGVRESQAEFFPDISLQGYFGQQALGIENLASRAAAFGAVGPALSLPIFRGGALRAQLRGAAGERDAAIAVYNQTVIQALRQTADVVVSLKALNTRRHEAHAALEALESAYRGTRLRYQGGLTDYQTVLLAEDQVLAQRRAAADLDSRAFSLDVALVRALGGGYAGA